MSKHNHKRKILQCNAKNIVTRKLLEYFRYKKRSRTLFAWQLEKWINHQSNSNYCSKLIHSSTNKFEYKYLKTIKNKKVLSKQRNFNFKSLKDKISEYEWYSLFIKKNPYFKERNNHISFSKIIKCKSNRLSRPILNEFKKTYKNKPDDWLFTSVDIGEGVQNSSVDCVFTSCINPKVFFNASFYFVQNEIKDQVLMHRKPTKSFGESIIEMKKNNFIEKLNLDSFASFLKSTKQIDRFSIDYFDEEPKQYDCIEPVYNLAGDTKEFNQLLDFVFNPANYYFGLEKSISDAQNEFEFARESHTCGVFFNLDYAYGIGLNVGFAGIPNTEKPCFTADIINQFIEQFWQLEKTGVIGYDMKRNKKPLLSINHKIVFDLANLIEIGTVDNPKQSIQRRVEKHDLKNKNNNANNQISIQRVNSKINCLFDLFKIYYVMKSFSKEQYEEKMIQLKRVKFDFSTYSINKDNDNDSVMALLHWIDNLANQNSPNIDEKQFSEYLDLERQLFRTLIKNEKYFDDIIGKN